MMAKEAQTAYYSKSADLTTTLAGLAQAPNTPWKSLRYAQTPCVLV